jgi:hypothetical protein
LVCCLEGISMAARKSISKKIRFEVFKRDSFKCQYCGTDATKSILHVDHIHPVSNGGDNSITNLITACFDCNMGKKARLLSDDSAVTLQKKQLDEMNERRNQLKMMMQWRQELKSIDEDTKNIAIDAFNSLLDGKTLNDVGESYITKALKKFSLNEVLDAIEISSKYIDIRLDEKAVLEGVNKALNSIGGICNITRQPKHIKDISYVIGICANRFSYCNKWQLKEKLVKAYDLGITVDDMKEAAINCKNWSQFNNWIDDSTGAIYG